MAKAQEQVIYVCIPTTPERRGRLLECLHAIHLNKFPHVVCIYESKGEGSVKGLLTILKDIDGIVAWLDDDCLISENYLETLYKTLHEKFPALDGAVFGFDQFHGDQLCVRPVCHSKLLKKYVHDGYYNWYTDTEFDICLRSQNKLFCSKEVSTNHVHYLNNPDKMDQTYRDTQSHREEDEKTYKERFKNKFYHKELQN